MREIMTSYKLAGKLVQCRAFDFGCAGTDKRSGSYFAHSGWFFVFQDFLLWQDTSKNCQLVGAE